MEKKNIEKCQTWLLCVAVHGIRSIADLQRAIPLMQLKKKN